jgi:putative aldouronate transport system permease protein
MTASRRADKRNRIKETTGDRVFAGFCYALSTFLLLIVLYPLYYIVINSFSNPLLVASNQIWFYPTGVNLEGYRTLFNEPNLMIGYANTLFYVVASTLLALAITLTGGYALSKNGLPGRLPLIIFIMIPMYFSGGMIPTFLLVRDLGLVNTRTWMVLSGAVGSFNLIIAQTFFKRLPVELEEAAYIDGCSVTRNFLQITLPLSKALIAVFTLWFVVGNWNAFFTALLYLRDEDKFPLQLFLRRYLINDIRMTQFEGQDAETLERMATLSVLLKYAMIVFASLPMIVFYPFVQKHFNKGVLVGSLKG